MKKDGTYESPEEYRQELRRRLSMGEAVYAVEVVPLLDKIDATKNALKIAVDALASIAGAYDQRTTDWARVTALDAVERMTHELSAAVDIHNEEKRVEYIELLSERDRMRAALEILSRQENYIIDREDYEPYINHKDGEDYPWDFAMNALRQKE